MTLKNLNRVLLMGNEAIARGALEGNVAYCTGYPGNPSSEIITSLLKEAKSRPIEVEWAVNEIVALEAAAAFSFSGLRAMVTMKQNGINVCSDFLTTVCLNKLNGGLLVVVCDDPGPLTSSNEEDSRHFAKIAQIPLLEPSTPQEAKDMTKWLLAFSERIGAPCLLRSVSRLSHGRGGVALGPVPSHFPKPRFDLTKPLVGLPFLVTANHQALLNKMKEVRKVFDESSFNHYNGPARPHMLIIAAGLGAVYANEAVSSLDLEDQVGVLKIGTSWPLPRNLIEGCLKNTKKVLFVEQVDPFIEDNVMALYARQDQELGPITFFGQYNGAIGGFNGPGVGEMNTNIVIAALQKAFALEVADNIAYQDKARDLAGRMLIPREIAFCPGCPHRASFYAIKTALVLDGRDGFVVGDIGCYGLAAGATGFNQIKALHCMGSGSGNATGFSKLVSFGFEQPAVAVMGDSTFYHASLPALVNAKHNNAKALFIILDNAVTAMTGFQKNPATPIGNPLQGSPQIPVEKITASLDIETKVLDPIADVNESIRTIYGFLQKDSVTAVVFRRVCATYEISKIADPQGLTAFIDQGKCLGSSCGCNRFCSRVLGCPAIKYDQDQEAGYIEKDICNACGLCVQLCPQQAISVVGAESSKKEKP